MRRDLGLIVSGVGFSAFGTCLSQLVLLLHFKEFGPVALSAFLVAAVLPASLGAPVSGLLVDRLPNRRLMQAAQLLQASAMLVISQVLDNFPLVLLAVLVLGCGTAVAEPAAAALVPHAAGPGDVARGYSWMVTVRATGYVLGTAGGGLLVGTIGAAPALLIDAGTYLVQAILLLFLRVERDPRQDFAERGGGAMAGLRHLWRDRVLAVGVGGLAVVSMCVVLINVADIFFITDVLHGGVVLVGWVYTAWMVGAVIGARLGGRLVGLRALVVTLGAGGVVLGAMISLPAVFPFAAVLVAGFVVGGIANGMTNVARQAVLRLRTPEHMHGRIFAAADSVMRTSGVVGTLVAGGVVAAAGPRLSMAIAGGAAVLAGLGVLVAARERETAQVA